MKISTTTTDALELLREHERALSRLYRTYAECFAGQSEFWLRLAAEEDEHAEWLGSLRLRLEDGESARLADRFPVAAIEHSLVYVNKLIANAHTSGITLLRALSVALDLEEALLESRYFEVCECDSPELKHMLEKLTQSTHAHLAAIRNAWQTTRETCES
jgi:hypothetical protein